MTIEQSHLQLSAQSSLSREQLRVRLVSAAAPPAKVLAKQASTQATPAFDLDSAPQGKLLLMRLIAEMMLGTKIDLFHAPSKGAPVAVPAPTADAPQPQVRSMQVRVEAEQLRFAAKGTVETAEGMRIDFQVDLALSRRFVEVVVGDGAASAKQDLLILNFASSEKSVGHRYAPIVPEAPLAQPANPMWDSAASAPCFCSQLPFERVSLYW